MLNKIVSIKPEQPVFSKENLCSKPINPTFNEFAKGEMLERYPFNQYSTLGEVLATMSPKEVATLSEKLTLFLVQSIN